MLDRVCAPRDYGPGGQDKDGLNSYWFWDFTSNSGSHTLGLVPQQIVDFQDLGEVFDPANLDVRSRNNPSPGNGVRSCHLHF